MRVASLAVVLLAALASPAMAINPTGGGSGGSFTSLTFPPCTPAALTVSTNNYNPGCVTNDLRISSTGAIDLTGMVAAANGFEVTITNVGAFAITLKHLTTSDASNQFSNAFGTATGDTVLGPRQSAKYRYIVSVAKWEMRSTTSPSGYLTDNGFTVNGTGIWNGAIVDASTELNGDWQVTPQFNGSGPLAGRFINATRQTEGSVSPTALAGDVNNYSGCNNYGVCIIDSGGSARNITGLAGGRAGDRLRICAYNAAGALTLVHNSGSSTAGNKFFFHDAANRTINPRQCRDLTAQSNGTDLQWWEAL